jgi:hypothetical protein
MQGPPRNSGIVEPAPLRTSIVWAFGARSTAVINTHTRLCCQPESTCVCVAHFGGAEENVHLVSAYMALGFRESDSGNRKWTLV